MSAISKGSSETVLMRSSPESLLVSSIIIIVITIIIIIISCNIFCSSNNCKIGLVGKLDQYIFIYLKVLIV